MSCTYSILITFFSIICSYVNFHDKQNSLSIINGSVFNWCTVKYPICSNTFIVNLEPVVLFYLHQLCCSEHRLAATLQHHTMTYYNYNSECLLVPSVGCYATHAVPCQGCQGLWCTHRSALQVSLNNRRILLSLPPSDNPCPATL